MRLRQLPAIALLLSGHHLVQAQQDHRLTLDADGNLAGLPAAYQPARLQPVFTALPGGPRLTALTLQLGPQQVQLPACLLELVQSSAGDQLRLRASWDHDESVLPYYLDLELLDPGFDSARPQNGGFSLLFNLRSARLVGMSVNVPRGGGASRQQVPVDLHARCAADELAGVLD